MPQPRKACPPCRTGLALPRRHTCIACKNVKVKPGALNFTLEGDVKATLLWEEFQRLRKHGGVDADRVRRLIDTWTALSIGRGKDVTFGLCMRIAKTINYALDPMETIDEDASSRAPLFEIDTGGTLEQYISRAESPIRPIWEFIEGLNDWNQFLKN